MPPKKVEPEQKLKLGRTGNTLRMGIVGLPNVGKSTTFNFLAKQNVPADNRVFCTIEPNNAVVKVPDARHDKLVSMWNPKSSIHAQLNIRDIAGLVRGASTGAGLGNDFLSHIRECDAIYHVVRDFADEAIASFDQVLEPDQDMAVIHDELLLKDQQILDKRIADLENKIARTNDKGAIAEKAVLDKVKLLFNENKWVSTGTWTKSDVEVLNQHLFLTAKPVLHLINLSAQDYLAKKVPKIKKISEYIAESMPGEAIAYSAEFETTVAAALADNPDDPIAKDSAVSRIIQSGYKALDLIHFFTAGADEVRSWTIRNDTLAPQAAGVIHTDFEKGFICAQVMRYEDFVEYKSEAAVSAEGKLHQKGKDYVVQDGDIIFFKFNVGRGK